MWDVKPTNSLHLFKPARQTQSHSAALKDEASNENKNWANPRFLCPYKIQAEFSTEIVIQAIISFIQSKMNYTHPCAGSDSNAGGLWSWRTNEVETQILKADDRTIITPFTAQAAPFTLHFN